MDNIYVQLMAWFINKKIPMGTNCASLQADLFLRCYERDFISHLQKSKRFYLIDNIFTIDSSEFEKHIPGIYPAEIQFNYANTLNIETSFLH